MHARAGCILLWGQVCKLTLELTLEEVRVNSPSMALVSKLGVQESQHSQEVPRGRLLEDTRMHHSDSLASTPPSLRASAYMPLLCLQ